MPVLCAEMYQILIYRFFCTCDRNTNTRNPCFCNHNTNTRSLSPFFPPVTSTPVSVTITIVITSGYNYYPPVVPSHSTVKRATARGESFEIATHFMYPWARSVPPSLGKLVWGCFYSSQKRVRLCGYQVNTLIMECKERKCLQIV